MEHQENQKNEEFYVSYPLSRIDGYDKKHEYKIGDIIRVSGDMYEINGLNRGDFVGKLIKNNRPTIKEQIISVFDSKKRKIINEKKEKIKEMIELTKELRQKYTERRGKRTETINKIEKIWPRYKDKNELKNLKEKLEQLDKKFLEKINEYCKKDDIDSLKELENYEQLNKEYNGIIKDLEEKLRETEEEQNEQKRKAEEARRRAKEARKAEKVREESGEQGRDAKTLFKKLVIKYHPDTTGTSIIDEILGRALTDTEKEKLKNE